MQVIVSTVGKFHSFDLARQLHRRGMLASVHTGYPKFKLRDEGLPEEKLHAHPWLRAPYMAIAGRGLLPHGGLHLLEHWTQQEFDAHVAQRLGHADVFVGLSGGSLRSGRAAQSRGMPYVCDRGSSHIQCQAELLANERERWGVTDDEMNHRAVDVELAEYEQADAITVPSTFSMHSFLARGVPASKLHCLPYGVDLRRFSPRAIPASGTFQILFAGGASLRKGIPHLLQAFKMLRHPAKRLVFAGHFPDALRLHLIARGMWHDAIELKGHLSAEQLAQVMSESHALALPSIEDGFGMVMAQAMACGCPVIASTHTGAQDLFTDGVEGCIVPPADARALCEAFERLASQADVRQSMSAAALKRVAQLGGWQDYGDGAVTFYQSLLDRALRA